MSSGSLLMAHHAAFLADLEAEANLRQQALTDGRERLHVQYLASVNGLSNDGDNSTDTAYTDDNGWFAKSASVFMTHDQQEIAAVFRKSWRGGDPEKSRPGCRWSGRTTTTSVSLRRGVTCAPFAARGQQRAATLAVAAGRGRHHAPDSRRAALAAVG